MTKYIPKEPLVVEIEKYIDIYKGGDKYDTYVENVLISLKRKINTLEVKEADLENYNKVKKVLSLSFMHFLDANRPEGKMCLSNGECFDIEKAFDELDFSKLFRYMEKYLKAQKGE